MRKGIVDIWRRMGRVAQAFILVTVAFLLLHFLHAGFGLQFAAGVLMIVLGLVAAYQIARRLARRAIWRLRNRLIVAYLFIAVVPIVLILALVIFAGKGIIGQVAVYLVDTELARRERFLQGEVSALVRLPPDNSESYRPPVPDERSGPSRY
jgi:phosphoserine phosphatase RsbU/P